MKRHLVLFTAALSFLCTSCAWIDDINTVSKKGSYTFTSTATESEDPVTKGGQQYIEDAISCINDHEEESFNVFSVHEYEDTLYKIEMFDKVRDISNSIILSIDFRAWETENPDTPCPTPFDLVGSEIPVGLDSCVIASISLGTCRPKQTYRLTGTLKLDEFSTTRRETVAGSLSGTLNYVRNATNGDETVRSVIPFGTVTADFQFPVHAGPPWMR